ncbi:MAG: 5'/3'-nucleotidase SurE [Anaerolineales bacterium]|nr:5'/3'-nucleotidase SurE [Anaerolineales bacterium]
MTNDDGIRSPGLWAAAAALEQLGFVTVAAPREQSSGTGRSLPSNSDGRIDLQQVQVNGRTWNVHAIGGTPAQAVLHGVLEILPQKPDLVVSGINYGENLGTGITVSGTVGAALEGAALGIPSIAISLETQIEEHMSYSESVDFSTAAYFTAYFARQLLARRLPADVDVLKIDLPADATPQTPWEITRLSRVRFYEALPPERETWDQPGRMGYQLSPHWQQAPAGSDVHAVRIKRVISVTPLSLDLTTRTPFETVEATLRQDS